MTCKHSKGDPECSSTKPEQAIAWLNRKYPDFMRAAPATPDARTYDVLDVARVGEHLVLKVRYPNCAKCAFEGTKVMVFLDVPEAQAMRWRRIDPHFRDANPLSDEAPSPAARFPATSEGWRDALAYAATKGKEAKP